MTTAKKNSQYFKDIRHLHLILAPVVDSAFTGKIAVEQVNEVIATTTSVNEPQHSTFKAIRYIPAFATEPTYIDLMVRRIKETLNQLFIGRFYQYCRRDNNCNCDNILFVE